MTVVTLFKENLDVSFEITVVLLNMNGMQ